MTASRESNAMTYIAVIKLEDSSALYFGPFNSYAEADAFAQEKFDEYAEGRCAYVDGLLQPVFIPDRKV